MKILLVDDSKINIMVGRRILERFGYGSDSVSVAFDGQEAIDASEKSRFDLIFMVSVPSHRDASGLRSPPLHSSIYLQDLSMPIVDGWVLDLLASFDLRARLITSSSSSWFLALDRYTANDRIRASPLTGTPVIIALTANADRDTRDLCEEKGPSRLASPPLFLLFVQASA